MEPADSDFTAQQRRARRTSPRPSATAPHDKAARYRHGAAASPDFDDPDESHVVRGYD